MDKGEQVIVGGLHAKTFSYDSVVGKKGYIKHAHKDTPLLSVCVDDYDLSWAVHKEDCLSIANMNNKKASLLLRRGNAD